VANAGNINLDGRTLENPTGIQDLVVGAPYDGPDHQGAVYIFLGTPEGINKKFAQVIVFFLNTVIMIYCHRISGHGNCFVVVVLVSALPGSFARQPCPAAMPVSLARQSCQTALTAALPGSLARQPCPAVGRQLFSLR
jgi:hypothetical protein